MPEVELMTEAERQLSVCNACRFCEGYCAVFPAASMRTAFTTGDISYLANLCHDCRDCYDACMFTPPHEFAINIPKILQEVRAENYERYNMPQALSRLFKKSAWPTIAIAVVVALFVLLGLAARNGVDGLFITYQGPGAFYRIVAYPVLVGTALVLTVWGLIVAVAGARKFAREADGTAKRLMNPSAWVKALWDAAILKYLDGGGVGCYYPAKRRSYERKVMHMLVFYGFILDFISTGLAFVYQDFLDIIPPFPIVSLPVLTGIVGGVMLVVGATGLLAAKFRMDPVPTSERMKVMDFIFIGSLDIVAFTGLLTVAFRGTTALPVIFAIHLGAIFAFFATAPYGKFVHFIYRVLALVKMHVEENSRPVTRGH